MTADRESFALYVHVPYCVSKCPYCDFNSHVVAQIPERQYTDSLRRELAHYAAQPGWHGRSLHSIFFGGGTPSTFGAWSIEAVLNDITALFRIEPGCEVTLEANPGTVDSAYFCGYRAAGVNRISLGIQSFQPRLLQFLGRLHSADEGRAALETVRRTGFDNFSLDLIFANPGQTLADLAADLATALEYRPPHLSAYNLTFEEGTPFYREFRGGKMTALSEDEEIAMAELIEDRLGGAGLRRYEISNYARAGRESRHNITYWQRDDYLGLGAGAHSFLKAVVAPASGRRWSNEKNPGRYMSRIAAGAAAVVESEDIAALKAAGEFLFLGLRMTKGVSCAAFCAGFGRAPEDLYPAIATWRKGGLMEEKDGYLRLTPRGLLLANSIFVEFM